MVQISNTNEPLMMLYPLVLLQCNDCINQTTKQFYNIFRFTFVLLKYRKILFIFQPSDGSGDYQWSPYTGSVTCV